MASVCKLPCEDNDWSHSELVRVICLSLFAVRGVLMFLLVYRPLHELVGFEAVSDFGT